MHLHELAPVGGRPASGRDGGRLERFADVREGLISRGLSHPGLLPLANLSLRVSRLPAQNPLYPYRAGFTGTAIQAQYMVIF